MKPKIYDCFCYFNEDMILELRLETLWNYVDYFLISEAVYTQSGKPKQLNFDISKFAKYKEKIRYYVVDHFPPGPMDFWKNENYQRNFLINGLYDASSDDWILVSDLDEIPNPELISTYNPKRYKRGDFQQRAYAYKLNNLSVNQRGEPALWLGSKITTFRYLNEYFGNVTSVRSYKSSGLFRAVKRYLFKRFQTQKISDGGWHFSWVFSLRNIVLKMESIAEQEYVKEEFKNPAFIEAKINSGGDILNRDCRYEAQEVDCRQFPAYLVEHKEKYSEWLLS